MLELHDTFAIFTLTSQERKHAVLITVEAESDIY